jgi:hypothetical protein
MLRTALPLLLVAAFTPALAAQPPQPPPLEAARGDAMNVRLSARVVVIERSAATRAGVSYVVIGGNTVRIGSAPGRSGSGVAIDARTLGARAFLELVRERRAIRSETVQQIVVRSGGSGSIASLDLTTAMHHARSRGPSLHVEPTVLEDGSIHLHLIARDEDILADGWGGYVLDGSPVDVRTDVIVQPGVETIVATSSAASRESRRGLLRIGRSQQDRDILVVITAEPAAGAR